MKFIDDDVRQAYEKVKQLSYVDIDETDDQVTMDCRVAKLYLKTMSGYGELAQWSHSSIQHCSASGIIDEIGKFVAKAAEHHEYMMYLEQRKQNTMRALDYEVEIDRLRQENAALRQEIDELQGKNEAGE